MSTKKAAQDQVRIRQARGAASEPERTVQDPPLRPSQVAPTGQDAGEPLDAAPRRPSGIALAHDPACGHQLDASLRSRLERAFGRDLGKIRVYDGESSEAAARSMGAAAFAFGQSIHVTPLAAATERILAHEVAHVMQTGGSVDGSASVEEPDQRLEREATAASYAALAGRAARVGDTARAGIHRFLDARDAEPIARRFLERALGNLRSVDGGYAFTVVIGRITNELWWPDRDEVAMAIFEILRNPRDPLQTRAREAHFATLLDLVASYAGGRSLLRALAQELRSGNVTPLENSAAADALAAADVAEARVEREARTNTPAARVAQRIARSVPSGINTSSAAGARSAFLQWLLDASLSTLDQSELLLVARELREAPRWTEFAALRPFERSLVLSSARWISGRLAELAEQDARMRASLAEYERTTGRIVATRPSMREELDTIASMGPFGMLAFYGTLLSGGDVHAAVSQAANAAGIDGLIQAAALVVGGRRAAASSRRRAAGMLPGLEGPPARVRVPPSGPSVLHLGSDDLRVSDDVPARSVGSVAPVTSAPTTIGMVLSGASQASLLQRARAAGVADEIEGPIEVLAVGMTQESATSAVEAGAFPTGGGNFGGRMYAASNVETARVFAARRVTNVPGSSRAVLGVAVPQSTFESLKQRGLVHFEQMTDPPPELVGRPGQWVIEPDGIRAINNDGFFFSIE